MPSITVTFRIIPDGDDSIIGDGTIELDDRGMGFTKNLPGGIYEWRGSRYYALIYTYYHKGDGIFTVKEYEQGGKRFHSEPNSHMTVWCAPALAQQGKRARFWAFSIATENFLTHAEFIKDVEPNQNPASLQDGSKEIFIDAPVAVTFQSEFTTGGNGQILIYADMAFPPSDDWKKHSENPPTAKISKGGGRTGVIIYKMKPAGMKYVPDLPPCSRPV